MGIFFQGTAIVESQTQGTPCVPVLSDVCICGDLERGKKEVWVLARGRSLDAEPGFTAWPFSVWNHWKPQM